MINIIQLQTLNWILENKDYSIITLNNINNSYFPAYEKEFDYIKEHFDTYGNVPDKTSFINKFPHFDIVKVDETEDYLINELYKDKKTRYLTSSFNDMRQLILKGEVEKAEALLNKITNETPQYSHINSVDILSSANTNDRYEKYVDKCNDFNKYYIKTGWPELDKFIGGWDRYEDLVTIVARPGVGKSWALLKIAVAAAEQGLNVGIYSGEMSDLKVAYRIDTLISHISNGQIIHGNDKVKMEYKKYLDNLHSKFKGSIKILTPTMLGGPAGISALRAFIEKDHLDMLCVDQHSLLIDDRGAKNPVEKASNISQDLKNLQVMKKVPIIAVSQQNRSSTTEKGVGTEHVFQSDRISQDSTILIFLEKKEKDDNLIIMHLTKVRDSGGGKELKYRVDYDKGIYAYIPVEDKDNDTEIEEQEYENMKMSYEPTNDITNGENPF